ncbi:MAG: MBL fold metallo-hydrolase [Rhodothermales bacterium]
MRVHQFTFNPFQTNGFICHSDGEAVLIDAPTIEASEHAQVEAYLETNALQVRHLLLTHAHIDHIFGCRHFSEHFGMTFAVHRDDLPLMEQSGDQAAMFGIPIEAPPVPDRLLIEGDVIEVGSARLRVLHTPGHSPGSVSFFEEEQRLLFSGDVLFAGSIGRTDLWRGSLPVLMESIFRKIMPLGDDVHVFPGHGAPTSIGRERTSNPFLADGYSQL